MLSVVVKPIILEPKHLDHRIHETIEAEVKRKYEKTCCEEHGLIISVIKVLDLDNTVNKDSVFITFVVKFKALTIKPEKGLQLTFTPTLIISKGVFGKLYENINLFIPESHLSTHGYLFDEKIQSFCQTAKKSKSTKIISKSNEVHAMIEDIKYDSIKYNCIIGLQTGLL